MISKRKPFLINTGLSIVGWHRYTEIQRIFVSHFVPREGYEDIKTPVIGLDYSEESFVDDFITLWVNYAGVKKPTVAQSQRFTTFLEGIIAAMGDGK